MAEMLVYKNAERTLVEDQKDEGYINHDITTLKYCTHQL